MDRFRHALSAMQIVAVIAALVVLFVIIASSEPLGLGRDLPTQTKMLIVLATMACGTAAGIVGIRGLRKK